ncbi:MAG TPA: hypothetical protein PKV50_07455 [Prolixibacteraceae bacterium]|jgi:hypothetical protein|nr:hypothetical protein [Prolixibacteraceae bacterium]
MVNTKELKDTLTIIKLHVVKARYNHLNLYFGAFWKAHFRLNRILIELRVLKGERKLCVFSFLLWLRLIPLAVVVWFLVVSLIGFLLRNLSENEVEFIFKAIGLFVSLPVVFLFHYLSNRYVLWYYKKIEYCLSLL